MDTQVPSVLSKNQLTSGEDFRRIVSELQQLTDEYGQYRNQQIIDLNAAHSLMSPLARAMMGSKLDDKGASGRLGLRRHTGIAQIEQIETRARELAELLFNANHVEFRPPSGALANMIATLAFVKVQDVLMAVPERVSGHWTIGKRGYPDYASASVVDVPYNDAEFGVDVEQLFAVAKMARPRMIVIGTSNYLFPSPVREIRTVADEVGAILLYDGAHVLGLIAGGEFQDPLREGAHLISASTQKTFPGPIGGIILTNQSELAARIQETTDNLISNYLNSRIAALAVTCAEMIVFGRAYARAIVSNARALAEALDSAGLKVLGKRRGFTASHQVIIDAEGLGGGLDAAARLERCGILCSHVPLPTDAARLDHPPTGVRFGVADIARRGIGPRDTEEIANLISRALLTNETAAQICKDVHEFAARFRQTQFCFS